MRRDLVTEAGTEGRWRELNEGRKPVAGCMLGSAALDVKCQDCTSCGWNPVVTAKRKRDIRRGVQSERERKRLTAARKTAVPDCAGWYNARKALPDAGERVIVTDGVFVGEAYLSHGGVWLRYGMEMVDRRTGIFPPVAWRPLPRFIEKEETYEITDAGAGHAPAL